MRLAVFRGGFTRMAAQQVAGASLPILSSFVNKSLVQCEPGGRYTIHELLRQYAEAEKVLTGAGYLAFFQEDYVAAHANFKESLALFRKLGHKDGIAGVLRGLGSMASEQGAYGRAETQLEESLALFRELGGTNGSAGALRRLGEVARDQGEHVRRWHCLLSA
jgi:tetratricopeptide (TPR) repeat protein